MLYFCWGAYECEDVYNFGKFISRLCFAIYQVKKKKCSGEIRVRDEIPLANIDDLVEREEKCLARELGEVLCVFGVDSPQIRA